ncbi:guanosine-5'-triphosphate,3'-diphosphate diphosphatase [Pseudoalteromonas byunsanensis]|uniref:Guanosine-5'-triphosphate,3'-diphosphate pyrophosphatase n=1 Tax=Pseudoalteromonas byunsanensis TaxID=327939 RepID=A0A1S1NH93_9GAMM|nr:guanosine-5'-triphosphate,3'-diphosphate diphosphatase [Pseudoalteromonas byunsanensis]OHU97953.1 guanosine-5'-triphosphate,3'-diphosphate pyrophosphatase [Pseudoalteromonas byunsanensis]
MRQKIPQSNVFAVIDLGSNSFHMLIARHVACGVHTIGRVKRKVRLAAGLDKNNVLSEDAMQRGWECLALFAERLQDIPKENISIVATATLRLAKNADQFRVRAEQILNHKINVISGELEAKTIYKGVAHTSACQGRQLVIDIGGASTEVVIGKGFDALLYKSLNMGCVTFLEQYFSDGLLSSENFNRAITSAKKVILPIQKDFVALGWELAIGASGTVQAIQEILAADGQTDLLTLEKLQDIQIQAIACQTITELDLAGLSEERRLVFVSGLAILIALFESLHIEQMGLAGGALREGVLYSMIPQLHNSDICKRTLDSFMDRYHVDKRQASYVAELALSLAKQLADKWQLDLEVTKKILCAVACVHEIGLIVDYKQYHKHSAYILNHTGMPGYSKIEKQMIVALTASHRADLNLKTFENLGTHAKTTERLSRIVRLAVILSMRRQDDMVPPVTITADDKEQLTLGFEADWLANHPLMESELEQEAQYQHKVDWNIQIERG